MPARFLIVVLLLLLAGCQSSPEATVARAPARPVDLSGNWELDYARSDNIQQQLSAIARQLQREAERRARAAERGSAYAGPAPTSGRDLMALAEMADLITAPSLLEVIQTEREVRLKRENSFALICALDTPQASELQTPFGIERCGWDGSRLWFDIWLPDGLNIRHRITRSALGDSLVIQTAVYSPTVREPFTVNRVFTRFNPDKAGYRCTQTLSRGRVCTTERAP